MSEELNEAARAFSDYTASKESIKLFIETQPLYVKLRVPLPNSFFNTVPEKIIRDCVECKAERPFRWRRPMGGSGAGFPPAPTRVAGVYGLVFTCTGCEKETLECFVEVNYTGEDWIQKVGQLPIWIPRISKEMEKELGDDAEIYKKALRNMNEGYGIGACAYLRRLLEKHINPLLELLHDSKAETGASEAELKLINDAIASKDFTSKTRFAAEISPASLLVEGHNPFQEIHERLSVGLHTLDEETANRYAQEIKEALEYVVRTLRRTHEERKAYASRIKAIRELPIK